MRKVLLVEDCKESFIIVNRIIGNIVDLQWADSMKEAKKLMPMNYDLVLLDLALPDGNGLELCSDILIQRPQTSIFFLTAYSSLAEKILAFTAGADDYIVKPFDPLELKVRIEAKFRKMEMLIQNQNILKNNEIEINKNKQEVKIYKDGTYQQVTLTALEFKLLIYFLENPGLVISRNQILNEIWGQNIHVYSRSVDTHVSKLRSKLGHAAHFIESVHGMGYKFSADLKEL